MSARLLVRCGVLLQAASIEKVQADGQPTSPFLTPTQCFALFGRVVLIISKIIRLNKRLQTVSPLSSGDFVCT